MINNERWEQIERIYHAALERTRPEARVAFLKEACRGDEELRGEVDSLLKFDDQGKSFIETPALELAARAMAAEHESQADITPFNEIGPYQLLSIIGRGGMGEIYLALDSRLNRKVAIKLLSAEFTADTGRVSRFKQEARTTSALNHPNIVTIHEIGELDGRHYIVTEYVEGETLRERISEAPGHQISFRQAVPIATQVVDALDAAHQAGIVHRDIKPENTIVRKDGLVKVVDFGIAKLTPADSRSRIDGLTTQTGIIMGTASYMSPEQVRGQKVDHRADIFSIGALLYEMLSGRKPFEGDTPSDVMAAVLIKDPLPLDQITTNVPPTLQRIVERCLEKAPEKRFQSASDLAFSLRELSVPISTSTENPNERAFLSSTASSAGSSKRLVWLAAITVIVFGGSAALLKLWPSGNSPDAKAAKLATVADWPLVAKPALPTDGDNSRLVWLDRSGNQLSVMGQPGVYSGPALSPNEDRVVVSLEDSELQTRDLWIFPVTEGEELRLTNDPADDINPIWSPDGKWIIYTSNRNGSRNIYRAPADGSGPSEPLLESTQEKNVEDISPDGRYLIFNTRQRSEDEPDLGTLSLANHQEKLFLTSSSREDQSHFSPDGRWVAYRSRDDKGSEIFIRRVTPAAEASTEKWRVSSGKSGATTPMWRGDGKELFYLADKTLQAVDLTPESGPSGLSSGAPKSLFKISAIEDSERRNRYLVTKDGQRFLFVVRVQRNP